MASHKRNKVRWDQIMACIDDPREAQRAAVALQKVVQHLHRWRAQTTYDRRILREQELGIEYPEVVDPVRLDERVRLTEDVLDVIDDVLGVREIVEYMEHQDG